MKTLHLLIIVFLLVLILFPFNTILAQNQNQPTIGFDQASYSTSSMSCNPYQQKITAQTAEQKKVTIIVTDPNANKFSTSIDRVAVSVWSDSDRKGIEITAYETEVNSGIFKGKVTISDGQSTQDIIHVRNGDTLSARYAGATSGSFDTTSHGITTTSFIGISCPPLERVPASSIRILDTRGNEHNVTTVDKQVLIVSDISNPTPVNQNFTYIVQIQDKNGSTASLAWLSGIMLPNQTSSPSVSWTPSKTGNYVVQIFVWQSLTNPNALSPPLLTDLTVLHDSEIYPKSPIGTVENLHCKLGFELMTKPTDGSAVCVTPSTSQKLAQRGWTLISISAQQNIPVLLNSLKISNVNFTIDYNITGNGKILDIKQDTQSKALILSFETTSNGTLTVSVPRALLDMTKSVRGEGSFGVLTDGREVNFTQTRITATDRIFSIPFTIGTHEIEIFVTQII